MRGQPLVSVLMTAYNREKYIAEAIESVLASTYTNFELIIVDDGSSDATVAISRKFEQADSRVHVYVNEHNLGDYPNRNKAASYAKGKYLKYIDADDLIYYYGLDVMVSYMEMFPEAGFGLASRVSDSDPFPICIAPREIYLENFNGFGHFDRAPGSSIINRDAFNSVCGFSGARMIGDYEFWFILASRYKMVKFPFDLYWNRIHQDQESKSNYASLYPQLRKKILLAALANSACPLTLSEIDKIKISLKKNELKLFFMQKLLWFKKIVK